MSQSSCFDELIPWRNVRASGGHLKLRKNRKISYLWYNCGWYLNMLFKLSFNSSYGLARVARGCWAEREREPVISLPYWPDVSDVRARKLCDWPVKKSRHLFLLTAKSK